MDNQPTPFVFLDNLYRFCLDNADEYEDCKEAIAYYHLANHIDEISGYEESDLIEMQVFRKHLDSFMDFGIKGMKKIISDGCSEEE